MTSTRQRAFADPQPLTQQSRHLAQTLRDWIADQGLTQPQAAKEDYLSPRNDKLPRVTSLHSMAEAIGRDPRELLGVDGTRPEQNEVLTEIRRLTEEVAELRRRLGGKNSA